MKKLLSVFVILFLALPMYAQDMEVSVKKHSVSTNSFWSNWFVSGGMDFNATYSSQETGVAGNPFSGKRGTLGFEVALGKWFTPGIGLRTKFQGVWGKQVNTDDSHPLFNGMNLHEDVMFNLTNMFRGYKAERLYNFIPYVGLGLADNFDDGDPVFSYNIGLLNNFRINNALTAYVDIYSYVADGDFDGVGPNSGSRWNKEYWDRVVGVSVGLTYNFGKASWKKTPDIDALLALNRVQVEDLNASLEEQQEENVRLREIVANNSKVTTSVKTNTNAVHEEVAPQVVCAPMSVFFNIGSAKIASRKDLVNIRELVNYIKVNGGKLLVTGYADSHTGNAVYNQKLSEKRAKAVAKELEKMGADKNCIEVAGKGGVNDLSPYSYNRRATVLVVSE